MREEPLSAQVVGRVLADAHARALFTPGFCVRTSTAADCHLLYFLALADPNGTPVLWLDFEPFEMGHPLEWDGQSIPAPLQRDTTVMWIWDQDAAEVAGELEAGLEKTNRTLNGFSLRYALEQLDASVEVAAQARAAGPRDPQRLQGSLEMLVNDHWAVTTYGLEAVDSPTALQVAWTEWETPSGAVDRYDTQLKEMLPEDQPRPAGYDEAITWVFDRCGWKRPDDPLGLGSPTPGWR